MGDRSLDDSGATVISFLSDLLEKLTSFYSIENFT
jgi:hypothetical protein